MKAKPQHPPALQQPDLPPHEWLRVNEAVHYSRLSKAKLYQLFDRGLIKTVSLRERGMVRGTRLVSYDSLRQFLDKHATGGEAGEADDQGSSPQADVDALIAAAASNPHTTRRVGA